MMRPRSEHHALSIASMQIALEQSFWDQLCAARIAPVERLLKRFGNRARKTLIAHLTP